MNLRFLIIYITLGLSINCSGQDQFDFNLSVGVRGPQLGAMFRSELMLTKRLNITLGLDGNVNSTLGRIAGLGVKINPFKDERYAVKLSAEYDNASAGITAEYDEVNDVFGTYFIPQNHYLTPQAGIEYFRTYPDKGFFKGISVYSHLGYRLSINYKPALLKSGTFSGNSINKVNDYADGGFNLYLRFCFWFGK